MNTFRKNIIFIILGLFGPTVSVFPISKLWYCDAFLGVLIGYKSIRYQYEQKELAENKILLANATTLEEKRILKKEITQKEKDLFSRQKTLLKIISILGSSLIYQASHALWQSDRLIPIKILGSWGGGFLFYKSSMFFAQRKNLESLKTNLEKATSSREAAFLRMEIKKLENELTSRKITIGTTTVGTILALIGLHQAIKRNLIEGIFNHSFHPPQNNNHHFNNNNHFNDDGFFHDVPAPAPQNVARPKIFDSTTTPEIDEKYKNIKNDCSICYESKGLAEFLVNSPCGHTICRTCAPIAWDHNHNAYLPQNCHICRNPIKDVHKVYLP